LSRLVRLSIILVAALALSGFARAAEKIVTIEIEGRLLEPREKFLRFLAIEPGAPFDSNAEQRVAADLARLGYRSHGITFRQGTLHLSIEPVRVVRHLIIRGNFPLFEDEVLRHLEYRTGSPLPPDTELRAALDVEEQHLREFLERDGYFGGSVKITPLKGPTREQIDLKVELDLGRWYPLGAVRGEGNTAISNDELFDIFKHCCFRWGRFSIQRMRDDAREAERVLREKGFPAARVIPRFDFHRDVNRKTEEVVLPVKVVEKRRVEVRFVGNRALSDKELRAQLTLYTSGAYDDVELKDSANAVHRYYQQHGFFEARVSFSRRRDGGGSVEEITFLVEEGPELKVRSVDFASESGAPLTFSDGEIKDKAGIETKVFPALGAIGLGEGGYVTTVQLQQDVERIVELYKSRGFPAVKVRAEVARDPSGFESVGALGAAVAGELGKPDLYVRFFVDEWRRERVDRVEVSFVGPHQKSERDILRVLKLTEGKPYTEAAFAEDQQRLVQPYSAAGRPYVRVDYSGNSWDAAHERITLRYRIEEGPKVTFGEILIRGNFKTRDRVILADLPFRPGDRFDLAKINEAERNLQTHGIFNAARVIPVRLSEKANPVPILVVVQERYLDRFGSLALGAGVSTDRLPYFWYVAVGWVWPNFFGFGSQLEIRGDFDWINSFGGMLRYTDLRAFGPGWRFDLSVFGRREQTVRFGQVDSFGGSVGLTRYLTPAFRLFGRYDIYKATPNIAVFRVEGPNDRSSIPDDTITAKVVLGAAWDRRIGTLGEPNPLMPAKGWLLSATLGWAEPYLGSDHRFLVISGQAMALAPVRLRSKVFTFIANFRYDEGIPVGESALPVVERFFGGGATATRGFDTDQLKTEIVRGTVAPLGNNEGFRVIPQGGNIRLLSTLEIQFPIANTFIGLPWPWVGAVFYDVGAIFDAPNQVQVSDFRHSVGITLLRVLTTFGPLSLEYGYPINQTLAEQRWKTAPWYSHYPGAIHFNWGIPLSRL
jgi:outer membrane protein assembly complex protein YaeT